MAAPDEAEIAGKVDQLVGRLDVFIEQCGKGAQTQTVVHKSSLGGFVSGMAIALCVMSAWYTMDVARTLRDELRDLKAWNEVLRAKVAKLEAQPAVEKHP